MRRKSRATIWVPALKSLEDFGLPKCPETMSEPRFVDLLYGGTCDVSQIVCTHRNLAKHNL